MLASRDCAGFRACFSGFASKCGPSAEVVRPWLNVKDIVCAVFELAYCLASVSHETSLASYSRDGRAHSAFDKTFVFMQIIIGTLQAFMIVSSGSMESLKACRTCPTSQPSNSRLGGVAQTEDVR